MLLFVLIGGTQTAWGPLAGSLFFTILPELFRVGGSWRYVVFGVLIVLMMVVRPEGIVTRDLVRRLSPSLVAAAPRREAAMAAEPALDARAASPSGSAASPSATTSPSTCRAGARMALIGPNGAGKTTLFNLDFRRLRHRRRQHHARTDSRSTTCRPGRRVRAGLSRSFQNIRLMPHLSVIENIMLGQHTLATDLGSLLSPLAWQRNSTWRRKPKSSMRRGRHRRRSGRGRQRASLRPAQENRGRPRADEPPAAPDAG